MRILQVIVAALFAGTLFFLLIALTFVPQAKPPHPILPISLTMIAAALLVVGLIARAAVLWNVTAKARREIANGTYQPLARQRVAPLPSDVADKPPDPCRDATYLLSVFQTKTIISAALFEGWAFFATVAYLIEGDPLGVGLAIVLIIGVAAHFPTQSRAIAWVEQQLELLEQKE